MAEDVDPVKLYEEGRNKEAEELLRKGEEGLWANEIPTEERARIARLYRNGDVSFGYNDYNELEIMEAISHVGYAGVFTNKKIKQYLKDKGCEHTDDEIAKAMGNMSKYNRIHGIRSYDKRYYTAYYEALKKAQQRADAKVLEGLRKIGAEAIRIHNLAVWELANYKQQKERKRWNEEGRKKANKKLETARKNWKYFNKRYNEVKNSTQTEFEGRYYDEKTGTYGHIVKMNRLQYLNHCAAETERWSKEMGRWKGHIKDYNYGINEATAAMNRMEKEANAVKPTVKADSQKGNAAKKQVRSSKKPPQTTVNKANNPTMPKEVEDYGKTLGQAYKLVTHADSKGNRIYAFEKDGKPAQVITQLKGQNPSKPLEVKSEGMIALMGQIAEAKKAKNSDFAELIGRINDQPTRDVINAAPKVKSEIKLPQQTPEIKIPEKIQTKPRVEVVYKTKKSGKQGKPQAIVLRDVNGKEFVLTPEIMENLAKKNKSSFFEKDMSDGKSRAEHTFKQYVEHIEKGDINVAGAVASFFKSEAEKPQMLTDAELKQQQAMIGNTVRGM